jgi:hypothetical protein
MPTNSLHCRTPMCIYAEYEFWSWMMRWMRGGCWSRSSARPERPRQRRGHRVTEALRILESAQPPPRAGERPRCRTRIAST